MAVHTFTHHCVFAIKFTNLSLNHSIKILNLKIIFNKYEKLPNTENTKFYNFLNVTLKGSFSKQLHDLTLKFNSLYSNPWLLALDL